MPRINIYINKKIKKNINIFVLILFMIFITTACVYNESKIDPLTVEEEMKLAGVENENFYSFSTFSFLLNSVPTSVNAMEYARIILEKSKLRAIDIALSKVEISDTSKADDLLLDLQNKMTNIQNRTEKGNLRDAKDVVTSVFNDIEGRLNNNTRITGVPTGFDMLDEMTSGFQKSDLILIAARPAMGKTAFVLNIASHVAIREQKKVAIFSLEMSSEQLISRVVSMESNIDSQKLKRGELSSEEYDKAVKAGSTISKSQIFLDDTPALSAPQIRSACLKLKQKHGLDMIIIDYLQLMSPSRKCDSRQQEVSSISRELKALAKELDVVLQINLKKGGLYEFKRIS